MQKLPSQNNPIPAHSDILHFYLLFRSLATGLNSNHFLEYVPKTQTDKHTGLRAWRTLPCPLMREVIIATLTKEETWSYSMRNLRLKPTHLEAFNDQQVWNTLYTRTSLKQYSPCTICPHYPTVRNTSRALVYFHHSSTELQELDKWSWISTPGWNSPQLDKVKKTGSSNSVLPANPYPRYQCIGKIYEQNCRYWQFQFSLLYIQPPSSKVHPE